MKLHLHLAGRAFVAVILLACIGLCIADPLELRVPGWVVWQSRCHAADLDGDSVPDDVTLEGGTLEVRASTSDSPYRTPASWRIQDAIVCDVTRDGAPEICMLAWRRGNYGSSRPFWDNGIDLRMTEPLFVMEVRDRQVKPVWMGHELRRDVIEVVACDDGPILLVERDGSTSRWSWEGFGFTIQ